MPIRIRVKPKGANDTSESYKSIGSAKVLCGRVFVLSVFVAPRSNPWLPADIELQKQKVFEAEKWLKMQAMRYGKRVEFVNSAFGSDGSFVDDDMPQTIHSSNAYSYPSEVLVKMRYRSREAFVEWVRTHCHCPQCLAIIFSNTQGRSFASPVSKELHAYDANRYNLECCFMYRYLHDPRYETKSADIAHEMLHLFGAWDLYELNNNDQARAIKTSEMFPNSIMRTTSNDIWKLQIDEITAWLVGLKDQGKDWYRWFEPDQLSYESE